MTKFDPTRPVTTRDGREAGIYATDGCATYPIHGWYLSEGDRRSEEFGPTGKVNQFGADSDCDLINIPEKPTTIERWVIVYDNGEDWTSMTYKSEASAREECSGCSGRPVLLTGTFTPGEGLTDED